jgi:dihydrofolate reductase
MQMRKIVAGLLMSLDGVVESPNEWGWGRYFNDEMKEAIAAGIAQADAVLLGRRTYLEFASLWPQQGSDVLMADFLNNSPKYVVSSTLRPPFDWAHSTVLAGDLDSELTRIKKLPGKNILIPGSPTLVRALLGAGLLDQLNLNVCPVVVGRGMRLFDGTERQVSLRLTESTVFKTGVVGLSYEAADGADAESRASFTTAAGGR